MRKIKFRGKRIDNSKHERKEFVYGSMLYLNTYDYDCYGNCKRNKKEEVYFIVGEDDINIVVDRDTIGQYTGLKDKNGNEIYEGDIVYVASEDENAIIEWDEQTARFILSFDDWFTDFDNYYGKDLEVIGNIYDNPDLIKE